MQRNTLIKNFFKGIIIGIGKIIPGVSGAILAITLGLYDKSIYYLNNLKRNTKESIKFLAPIAIGIMIGIITFSKIIEFFLQKYYLLTMLFFIGLIIGGIPTIIKSSSKKYYPQTIIVFIIFFLLSITNIDNNYVIKKNILDTITFLISGFVEAIGTTVPGISSTALLMITGTYNHIIKSIGNIYELSSLISNLKIILPFILGLIIGLIITIKIISILFQKSKEKVYNFVLGILLSSIVLLIIRTLKYPTNLPELIMGLFLMIIGILVSSIMEEKQ